MGAGERAFWGCSSNCPMRRAPEPGGSPPGTLHRQATAYCRSGICIRGRDMHAEEETKHSPGTGAIGCQNASLSSHPSSTSSSGAPIGQQASFKQSVPALKCRSCLGKGLGGLHVQDRGQVQVGSQPLFDDGLVVLNVSSHSLIHFHRRYLVHGNGLRVSPFYTWVVCVLYTSCASPQAVLPSSFQSRQSLRSAQESVVSLPCRLSIKICYCMVFETAIITS